MHRATWVVVFVVASITAGVAQANATLDTPFQVRYASNLNIGDSVVDISNSGASGGNICTNVYTFSPDEQEISCCSCVVTPNALVSLSVKKDLISNTLTPAVPTSVVIKLLSTAGGACNASAPGALATGLLAWGTTLHAVPNPSCSSSYSWCKPSYHLTETAFTPSSLSAAELARISALCGFIQSNGSGFGICRSCRLGGLASVKP